MWYVCALCHYNMRVDLGKQVQWHRMLYEVVRGLSDQACSGIEPHLTLATIVTDSTNEPLA